MNIKAFDRSNYLAAVLLIITICAMMTQYLSKTKVLDIHQLSPSQVRVFDNRDESGESIAKLSLPANENEPLVLSCQISNFDENSTIGKHFCRLSLFYNSEEQGLDLSSFDSFLLWIKYEEATTQGIRFLARNFNPAYSRVGDNDSLKYNIVELTSDINPYPIHVPFQSFQVPPWWLTSEKLSHEHGIPEFNNVHRIDVFTGFAMPPGNYRIIVEKIAVTGKWVNIDTVYVMLLIFWVLVGLMYLLSQLKIFAFIFNRNSTQDSVAELKDFIRKTSLIQKPIVAIDSSTGAVESDSLATLLHEFYKAKNNYEISVMIIEWDRVVDTSETCFEEMQRSCLTVIEKNTRELDTIARWKDKGFVIVLPYTDLVGASNLAEKLRLLVEKLDINPAVTVSIGVATLEKTKPQEIFEQAIKAIKSAKYQGGNRVVAATPQLVDIQFESSP